MSFWIDWWLLLGSGVILVILDHLVKKNGWIRPDNPFFVKNIAFVYLIGFYILSGSLFVGFTANGANPFGLGYVNDWFFAFTKQFYPQYYAVYPDATSTEFMFSSAAFWLKDLGVAPFMDLQGLLLFPFHLFIGIALFMFYPFFLKWGIAFGYLLFGSAPNKRGMLAIF